jgi:hypothetical protein
MSFGKRLASASLRPRACCNHKPRPSCEPKPRPQPRLTPSVASQQAQPRVDEGVALQQHLVDNCIGYIRNQSVMRMQHPPNTQQHQRLRQCVAAQPTKCPTAHGARQDRLRGKRPGRGWAYPPNDGPLSKFTYPPSFAPSVRFLGIWSCQPYCGAAQYGWIGCDGRSLARLRETVGETVTEVLRLGG